MRGSAGIGAGSSTTGSALGRPASRAAGMSSPTAAPRRLDSGGGSGSGGGGREGGGGGGSAAPSIPRLRFTTADLTMGATLGAWVRRDAVVVLGCHVFLCLFLVARARGPRKHSSGIGCWLGGAGAGPAQACLTRPERPACQCLSPLQGPACTGVPAARDACLQSLLAWLGVLWSMVGVVGCARRGPRFVFVSFISRFFACAWWCGNPA
jgi:hypothetical protein